MRTLVNLCRDRYRRRDVRQRYQPQAEEASQPAGAGNPESAAVARTTVQSALRRLPPRRRAIVLLHELEALPVAQIARLLGINQVTVRWHLSAGRQDLARILLDPEARKETGTAKENLS